MKLRSAHLAYVLIFLTPFSIYAVPLWGSTNSFTGLDIAPAVFFSLCFIPVFIIRCLVKHQIPSIGLLGILHIIFFVITLIGIVFVDDKWGVVKSAGVYSLKLFPFFLFMVAFLQTRREVETAVLLFIIAGLLNSVMGWVQFIGFWTTFKAIFPPFAEHFSGHLGMKPFGNNGQGAFGIPGLMRMFGFFNEGNNIFGSFTLIPLGLSAYMATRYGKVYKWLTVFFLVTILVSFSRNAYLGLISLGSIAFLLFSTKAKINRFMLVRRTSFLCLFVALFLRDIYANGLKSGRTHFHRQG